MSNQKSQKLSAYQVFSSVTKVQPNTGKTQELEELKLKNKFSPKTNLEVVIENKKAPKSLVAMVNNSDQEKVQSLLNSSKYASSSRHSQSSQARSGNSGTVKSLLDISFEKPLFKPDIRQQSRQIGLARQLVIGQSRETRPRKQMAKFGDLKSLPDSNLKPVVVELQPSNEPPSLPKSLLELSPIGLTTAKLPSSLFGVTQPPKRKKSIPELAQDLKKVKIMPTPRLNISARKPAGLLESARSPQAQIDMVPEVRNINSSKQSGITQQSQKFSRITACQGKNCYYLIIPTSQSWVHFCGKARVSIEKGIASIMAFTLPPKVPFDIYSPTTGCLLAMHIDDLSKISADDVRAEMKRLCGPGAIECLQNLNDDTIAILKVEQLKSQICDYLTTLIPFTQLFRIVQPKDKERTNVIGATLTDIGLKVAPGGEMFHTCMNWSSDYNDVLEKWSCKVSSYEGQSPILLTCGGKNSGKSILNRCAVNVTLQSVREVAYLDCDVGQTEFSPPATLSLHLVKHPILGPPFSHQIQAEKMIFFGDVNPAQDPGLYIRCLQEIYQTYRSMADTANLPLIVNTMGFPEGVGLMLFIDTMNIVKPDLVIQLESVIQYNNFPAVTQEMVALDEGWIFNKRPPEDVGAKVAETKAHELVMLSSLASNKRDFSMKLQPMDLRMLTLLSHMSQGLEEDITLMSLTPFAVSYRHVAVHVCHHRLAPQELLVAVDASVVALCCADLSQAKKAKEDLPWFFEEVPICPCLGMGIIRAVDEVKGVLHVVTTLPRTVLRKVNTILKGSLALPDHFFLNQQKGRTTSPYVDALAPSTAVTPVRPRARMPRITHSKD